MRAVSLLLRADSNDANALLGLNPQGVNMYSVLTGVIEMGCLIGIQVFLFWALVGWVNRRSDYFTFRRWRAAMITAAASTALLDIMIVVFMFRSPSGATAYDSIGTGLKLSEVVGAVAAMSCLSLLFALVVMAGAASRLRGGFDSGIGVFDWADRIWSNPFGTAKENQVAIRDNRRF
jgi:hypothetical protein